ncbi:hypothetical protein GCM10027176_41880 [Actinoallomurus bryophytorum]
MRAADPDEQDVAAGSAELLGPYGLVRLGDLVLRLGHVVHRIATALDTSLLPIRVCLRSRHAFAG